MRSIRATLLMAVLACLAVGCGTRGAVDPGDVPNDPGPGGGSPDDTSIVGIWDVVSVNGSAVTVGSLRWIFTESAYTAIITDCTETGSYTYEADTLRATTGALTGPACAGTVGVTAEYHVTIGQGALVADIPNTETGETMILVFIRV